MRNLVLFLSAITALTVNESLNGAAAAGDNGLGVEADTSAPAAPALSVGATRSVPEDRVGAGPAPRQAAALPESEGYMPPSGAIAAPLTDAELDSAVSKFVLENEARFKKIYSPDRIKKVLVDRFKRLQAKTSVSLRDTDSKDGVGIDRVLGRLWGSRETYGSLVAVVDSILAVTSVSPEETREIIRRLIFMPSQFERLEFSRSKIFDGLLRNVNERGARFSSGFMRKYFVIWINDLIEESCFGLPTECYSNWQAYERFMNRIAGNTYNFALALAGNTEFGGAELSDIDMSRCFKAVAHREIPDFTGFVAKCVQVSDGLGIDLSSSARMLARNPDSLRSEEILRIFREIRDAFAPDSSSSPENLNEELANMFSWLSMVIPQRLWGTFARIIEETPGFRARSLHDFIIQEGYLSMRVLTCGGSAEISEESIRRFVDTIARCMKLETRGGTAVPAARRIGSDEIATRPGADESAVPAAAAATAAQARASLDPVNGIE